MIEISLNNIQKNFGFDNILENISFEIKTGEVASIIGDNGCGKSTILKIINNIEKADSGIVTIRCGSTIGYLSQIPEEQYKNYLVKDMLYQSFSDVLSMENEMKKYEEMMNINPSDKIINKYLAAQEKFINAGGYEINTKIEKIVHGFNLGELINKKFHELSGGEQKRVVLAQLIILNPSILLLDEPTNHLDIASLEWFENYIKKYRGTVLVVSHDRYFLDKVTNKTILIENGKSIIFHGNYSYYLKENELRMENEFKEYKDQQKLICALKKKIKQLEEFGRLAYPGGDPFFRRAENIRKRLNRLELIDKPKTKNELPINLSFDSRTGKDVLVINDLDLFVENKVLLSNVNFKLNYGDKVCILGNNGCGKTTLIKEIIKNNSDNIKLGSNVKIGYIPQIIDFESDITVLDFARKYFIGDEAHLRSLLSKFYFYGENVFKKISKLSGGEKIRLKLFELINNKSNFIILDEPTNHIDIYTKETLENALNDFYGTVLFVSHDRYFINKLANKILYINNNQIKESVGNYDYFISKVNKNSN